MLDVKYRTIGYFACSDSGRVFCHPKRKVVVAHTKNRLLDYLYEPDEEFEIIELNFDDIIFCMQKGGVILF